MNAAAQGRPDPGSARGEIQTTLRSFYFSLAHKDWEAVTADILAAKVVAHRPAPDALVAVAAARRPTQTSCAAAEPGVEDAVVLLNGDWAEVSVPRCGGADGFRLIRFEARWRIVSIRLFQEPMAVSAEP